MLPLSVSIICERIIITGNCSEHIGVVCSSINTTLHEYILCRRYNNFYASRINYKNVYEKLDLNFYSIFNIISKNF